MSVYSLFSDYLIGIQQCLIESKERLIAGSTEVGYSFVNVHSKWTTGFEDSLVLFKLRMFGDFLLCYYYYFLLYYYFQ